MTRDEVQAVIDKGLPLVSDNDEIHFGCRVEGDKVHWEYSRIFYGDSIFGPESYTISNFTWREPTEDEIKQYVK